MIYALTPVKAARSILGKLAAIEVNALLQIGIRILEKQENGLYLIRMGQHTFTTKSEKPLETGREYWVEMAQTREGIVHLKNIHPKPRLVQKHFENIFSVDFLKQLVKRSDPDISMKEHLLQWMAATTDKEQFQNATQLLLSLHHGVFTLPVREEGKRMMLQVREGRKNGDLNQKRVEFYAAMNNLGPVEGVIARVEHRTTLRLELFYPKSVALLESRKEGLDRFDHIEIRQRTTPIEPFWDGETSGLLDIKG